MTEADQSSKPTVETDDRFPSGPWVGFFVQRPDSQRRQQMDLTLTFVEGRIRGEGSDTIGEFTMRGRYDLKTAKVTLHKQYLGRHRVFYEGGVEDGKGIWGVWTVAGDKGGFHIWPKGMADPTQLHTAAEMDTPAEREEAVVLVKT